MLINLGYRTERYEIGVARTITKIAVINPNDRELIEASSIPGIVSLWSKPRIIQNINIDTGIIKDKKTIEPQNIIAGICHIPNLCTLCLFATPGEDLYCFLFVLNVDSK